MEDLKNLQIKIEGCSKVTNNFKKHSGSLKESTKTKIFFFNEDH